MCIRDRTYFAYTEPEKAEFLKRIGGAKYTIQRSKGLGENDAEMMWPVSYTHLGRGLFFGLVPGAAGGLSHWGLPA